MYSVLGLDQAMRHTGWAYYRKDAAVPASGTFELPYWGNEEGRYAYEWWRWLIDFCRARSVTHLFFEAMPGGKPNHFEPQTEQLGQKGLFLLADMAGHELGIPSRMVAINSWRERFIGTSIAPPHFRTATRDVRRRWFKDQALKACAARGWFSVDHNAAEAMGIMDFGVCTIDPLYASRTDPIFRRQEAAADRMRVEA
jgi:hypothetical protein